MGRARDGPLRGSGREGRKKMRALASIWRGLLQIYIRECIQIVYVLLVMCSDTEKELKSWAQKE
jgi:hypothetical protein